MNRYVSIVSLGITMCLVCPGCDSPEEQPQEAIAMVHEEGPDKFFVTIWTTTTRVEIYEGFEVVLRVVNATTKPQSFRVMGG